MCSSGAESRLPTALLLVLSIFQPAKRTQHPHQIPGLEYPVCSSHCSVPWVGVCLCIFSFFTAGALSPTLLLFFPSYPIICTTFLHPGLYKSPSAIFQLVFNENYLICRYIFDMFLGLAELHTLLLYHFGLSPFIHN